VAKITGKHRRFGSRACCFCGVQAGVPVRLCRRACAAGKDCCGKTESRV